MSAAIQGWVKQVVRTPVVAEYGAVAHERLRFRAFFAIAIFKLFNFFGGNWDIQWHVAIGRDSLFIPPHLMVMVAFFAGLLLSCALIAYETRLRRAGVQAAGVMSIGPFSAPAPTFGIFFGYAGALFAALFDEAWHRIFGIDSTLWSPPHILIMLSTSMVDFSLLAGFATSARRLGMRFTPRSAYFWGLCLAGAFAFEAVNFQMGEAFIVAFRKGGVGLLGILYPIMVGALYPLALLLTIRLAGKFWAAIVVFAITISLQYIATGISAAGFDILKPVSIVDKFVIDNPNSTLANVRAFAQATGFTGLVGLQQAWFMWLSFIPMALVSLLEFFPYARRHPLVAAPMFSASLVVVSFLWFERIPLVRDYPVTWGHVLLGALLSAGIGTLMGWLGLKLATAFTASDDNVP